MENRPVEISLTALWNAVRKKIGVILLATVVVAVAVGVLYSVIYQPSYSSTSRYYVNNVSDDTSLYSSSQTAGAAEMASNYVQFISGNDGSILLNMIIQKNQLEMNPQALSRMITAKCNGKDATFSVTVEGRDPEMILKIAQAIEKVYPLYCHYMNGQISIEELNGQVETVIATGASSDSKSVKLYQNAILDTKPDNASNRIVYPLFAGVAVFLIGVLIAIFAEFFNTTIYEEKDLRERFPGIPVIGVVPHWSFHHSASGKNVQKGDNGK